MTQPTQNEQNSGRWIAEELNEYEASPIHGEPEQPKYGAYIVQTTIDAGDNDPQTVNHRTRYEHRADAEATAEYIYDASGAPDGIVTATRVLDTSQRHECQCVTRVDADGIISYYPEYGEHLTREQLVAAITIAHREVLEQIHRSHGSLEEIAAIRIRGRLEHELISRDNGRDAADAIYPEHAASRPRR